MPPSTSQLRVDLSDFPAGSPPTGPVTATPARQELTHIAELILASDVRAIPTSETEGAAEESRLTGRKSLAASLGCRVEDIQEIVESYGEEEWEERVVEERVRLGLDSTLIRDATWDRLESATLRKLFVLVEADRIKSPMELLAIAKAANVANRGSRKAPSKSPSGGGLMTRTDLAIGFLPGDPDRGVLPAGNLGQMQLRLSHRVQQQLTPVDTDADSNGDAEGDALPGPTGRILDSIEMLDLKAIQEAGESSDES